MKSGLFEPLLIVMVVICIGSLTGISACQAFFPGQGVFTAEQGTLVDFDDASELMFALRAKDNNLDDRLRVLMHLGKAEVLEREYRNLIIMGVRTYQNYEIAEVRQRGSQKRFFVERRSLVRQAG